MELIKKLLTRLIPNSLRAMARSRWFRVWVLEGSSDGLPLRVLFGGSAPDRSYVEKQFFDGDVQARYQGRKASWAIPAVRRSLRCDISLTPPGGRGRDSQLDKNEYRIPRWLTAEVEISKEYPLKPLIRKNA